MDIFYDCRHFADRVYDSHKAITVIKNINACILFSIGIVYNIYKRYLPLTRAYKYTTIKWTVNLTQSTASGKNRSGVLVYPPELPPFPWIGLNSFFSNRRLFMADM